MNKCVALLISPKVTVKVLEVYIQCCLSDFFKVFCYSLWPFCSLTVCCLFVKKIYTVLNLRKNLSLSLNIFCCIKVYITVLLIYCKFHILCESMYLILRSCWFVSNRENIKSRTRNLFPYLLLFSTLQK